MWSNLQARFFKYPFLPWTLFASCKPKCSYSSYIALEVLILSTAPCRQHTQKKDPAWSQLCSSWMFQWHAILLHPNCLKANFCFCWESAFIDPFFPAGASSTRRLSQKIGMAANAFESSCLRALAGRWSNGQQRPWHQFFAVGYPLFETAWHEPYRLSQVQPPSNSVFPTWQIPIRTYQAHEIGLMHRYRFVEEMPC